MHRNQKQKAITYLMAALRHLQIGYPLLARDALEAALQALELLLGAVPDYSCMQKPVAKDYRYFKDNQNLEAKLTTSRCIMYAINELHANHGEGNACGYIWTALCQLNAALHDTIPADRIGPKRDHAAALIQIGGH